MSFCPGVPAGSTLRWNGGKNRPRIDWSAIERDYRTGVMSLRDMADKHGCSHSTIANYAGRQGWKRNFSVLAVNEEVTPARIPP